MAIEERTIVSDEVIEGYSKIDATCIGDAVRGRGLNCLAEGLFPLSRDMKVCGRAVTLRHIAARDTLNRARHEQVLVEMCRPGDVLVIDMGGRIDGGTWGGLIAIDAIHRGLNGVVIDGGTRDSEELIELGFPTFARGLTLKHTHGSFVSTCLNNEPIQIGAQPFSVMVAPGDVIVGDADGVVIVPAEHAEEILPVAQRRHELDLHIADLMRAGKGHGHPDVDAAIAEIRGLERVQQAGDYKW